MVKKKENTTSLTLRLPNDLKKEIEQIAHYQGGRSLNSIIVESLQTFARPYKVSLKPLSV